jgi:hypothetical protein
MSLTRAFTAVLKSAASASSASTRSLGATLSTVGHFYGLYESSVSNARDMRRVDSLPSATSSDSQLPDSVDMDNLSEDEIVSMLGLEAASSSSLPSSTPSLASQLQQWWRQRRNDEGSIEESSSDESGIENNGIWLMAVPKRKPSHAVKRKRQMNPLYQNEKEILVSLEFIKGPSSDRRRSKKTAMGAAAVRPSLPSLNKRTTEQPFRPACCEHLC